PASLPATLPRSLHDALPIYLIILGRVEEVVTTATGVRYVPQFIENQLKFSPYVKEAAVIGAGKPYLTAIICIDYDAVGHWAEGRDRKSTRLNSSHVKISYAV